MPQTYSVKSAVTDLFVHDAPDLIDYYIPDGMGEVDGVDLLYEYRDDRSDLGEALREIETAFEEEGLGRRDIKNQIEALTEDDLPPDIRHIDLDVFKRDFKELFV